MKQKIIAFSAVAATLCALFTLAGCQKSDVSNATLAPPVPFKAEVLDVNPPEHVDPASVLDVVATEQLTTKSGLRVVLETLPILGANGDTLMYAVNYKDNQGFTLISATRNYTPILAEVEQGNYSPDSDNPGLAIWMDETKAAVEFQRNTPDSTVLTESRNAWSRYAKTRELPGPTKVNENDVWDLVNSSMSQWSSEGYQVVTLGSFLESYNYKQSIKDAINNEVRIYANKAYNINMYVFVLVKNEYQDDQKGPLMNTLWDQRPPFNNELPYYNNDGVQEHVYAGCTNIAVGQIMKYHQWPAFYNWSQIGGNNTATSTFIKDLYSNTHSTSHPDGLTGAWLKDARSALFGYGYTTSTVTKSFNSMEIQRDLNLNNPVLMVGYNSAKEGHTWVCDGWKSTATCETYIVKALQDCPPDYIPRQYNTIYNHQEFISPTFKFYMNWGWGFYGNNGFFDNNSINYYSDREFLLNIHPK